ncbi:MAG: efflux RND transporter periplasmic adaptor subunit [Burkholderiales bacterium]|jgi:HlyD family secretion protein|nr:MAG: efflux RND transporter periplasmic adaptor subunit [Burkholderiales bacterium]
MSAWINRQGRWLVPVAVAVAGAVWLHSRADSGKDKAAQDTAVNLAAAEPAAPVPKAALSVQIVRPQAGQWPMALAANGAVAAWQEAVIGAELSGQRLSAVQVNVGDKVSRGQVLATLQTDAVSADVNNARAALAEAEALMVEAKANADRARTLHGSGVMSLQDSQRALTTEQTAKARVDSAKAQLAAQELRLRQTRIVASDDGVISARLATVGAVVQPGQELFRLIRQSRLEWRAEVPSADLQRIKPGMTAWATPPGGAPIQGKVRMVAPTVDATTRNGLVYVDLPASAMSVGARAGMFAAGRVEIGQSQGLTLPQTAVLLRDGFSYVFKVGPQGLVTQLKVSVGRRVGDRVEILNGLTPQTDVVASGVGFLSDGDSVRVVKGQS